MPSKPLHLISLGSSFAAGPGLPPFTSKAAARSSSNYPSLLAQHFNYNHTDLTVSGATLSNITTTPQTTHSGTTFAPQLDDVPESADIITLTAGGNDLNYVGGIITEEFKASWIGWVVDSLVSIFRKAGEEEKKPSVDELAARFGDVLDAIHAKAPKAKIYLVEYLTLLSPSTRSGVHVSMAEEEIKRYQQVGRDLQSAYEAASGESKRREWCKLVGVAERSREHGIGTMEPWVDGLSVGSLWRGNPVHPNQRGMRAVADLLIERLEADGYVVS